MVKTIRCSVGGATDGGGWCHLVSKLKNLLPMSYGVSVLSMKSVALAVSEILSKPIFVIMVALPVEVVTSGV